MRLLPGLLGAAVALIVLGCGLLLLSSRFSLDDDYGHTRRTEALPPLSPGDSAGLVRIAARGMVFRARRCATSASRERFGHPLDVRAHLGQTVRVLLLEKRDQLLPHLTA